MKNGKLGFVLLLAVLLVAGRLVGSTLTHSVAVSLSSKLTTSGFSTTTDSVGYSIQKSFDAGSGTTQVADLVYSANRTLSSGASESLDLYGGLTDAFGATLNFVRIKVIVVENTSASMTLTLGNGDNPFVFLGAGASTVDVKPSGAVAFIAPLAGWAVTADTADIFKVLNSSGSATTYRIFISGSST